MAPHTPQRSERPGGPPAPPDPPQRSERPGEPAALLDTPQRSERPGEPMALLDTPRRSERPGGPAALLDFACLHVPISRRRAAARSSAMARMRDSSAPSIITRASASVPE